MAGGDEKGVGKKGLGIWFPEILPAFNIGEEFSPLGLLSKGDVVFSISAIHKVKIS